MNHFVILSILLIYQSCVGQEDTSSTLHPKTPSQEYLETLCEIDATELRRQVEPNAISTVEYFFGDQLYSGWACQVFTDTDHRYRFSRYENGVLVRQIGYFDNGNLGHDFSMQNGNSIGSERMWRRDGNPYVRNYYLAPGVKHDYQRRWEAGGHLVYEALFEKGKEIYAVSFDGDGNVISGRGDVPEKWR